MKTIEYFEVEENDGDRMSRVLARFANEADALAMVGKNPYRTVIKRSINIFDSTEDYNHNNDKEIRKRALAKLDREEQRVLLGLTYREV